VSSVGYGTRISQLAEQLGDQTAIWCADTAITWLDLERRANRCARLLASCGATPGDFVSIALPNGIPAAVWCIAAWKIGAVPNPINHRLPPPERAAILERAAPAVVVAETAQCDQPHQQTIAADARLPDDDTALADIVPPHERALASGGSTGTPKLIVVKKAAAYGEENPSSVLVPQGSVLVPGPLYHAAPFGSFTQSLIAGVETVLMDRFDPARCLELIERHRISQVLFVPTMMHRIWRLPEEERRARDVSSLRTVFTGGAPCPQWLMRAWIEWLGPDVMHELYGPSERIGGTHITGREWLDHPGSVGKPAAGARIRILDPETLRDLPPRKIGEVFMMPPTGTGSTYRYVGAERRATEDGWESVGDMGYVDEDGYLYLTDRRTDMILCGGRNVYPAQIEAAIDAFPGVLSSAVIGLPDDDLGNRIHAVVQSEALDEPALREHLGELIARYCIPHSFERVDFALRDDAGKVRRYQLREERLPPR
jgi:bile acid-coenzyme A ligase